MKKILLALLAVVGSLSGARATNYYVASGANAPVAGVNTTAGGQGLSAAKPFATIQYAADRTLPGDTVFVRAGTYTNLYSNVANLTRPGTPSRWITYRNYPGDAQRPLLRFTSWQGFQLVDAAAYIEIRGFRIQGNNRNVTLADALNQPGGCAQNGVGTPDPRYNGGGISVEGRPGNSTAHPHHLRFVDNEVFECGAGGISAIQADYVTIENNLVYDNSWYTIYGGSGISILSAWNYDQTTGYRTIVRGNRCFGNKLLVPWYNGGRHTCVGITDGNGIIIDSNADLAYSGRTLVANNLVVNNGGSGIHSYKSNHVDVINNTAYHNSQSVETTGGEIYANSTNDALFQNNILVADAINVLNTNYNNASIVHTHNLYFGGTGAATAIRVLGANPVQANPQFVNPTTDWATANFRLRGTSPAIDAGLNSQLPATDLDGNPRVAGANPDLGAYEYRRPLATGTPAGAAATLEVFPNPASGPATLRYHLARAGAVRLEVVDALGRRVALLVVGTQAAGLHEAAFVAPAGAGVYHARLVTPDGRAQQTLTVVP